MWAERPEEASAQAHEEEAWRGRLAGDIGQRHDITWEEEEATNTQ
jgi:hypothetical protein